MDFLKAKHKILSRQRRRSVLRRLDKSVMRAHIDPDVFLFEFFQLHDELSDLGEVVSNERLTTIFLGTLLAEKYATIKIQATRDPNLRLEEITKIMKTIFINHSERSSVPKGVNSRIVSRESGREPTMSDRESAMVTAIACHNCKMSGYKKKDCNRLSKRPDKLGNLESSKKNWCTYHRSNVIRMETAISSTRRQVRKFC